MTARQPSRSRTFAQATGVAIAFLIRHIFHALWVVLHDGAFWKRAIWGVAALLAIVVPNTFEERDGVLSPDPVYVAWYLDRALYPLSRTEAYLPVERWLYGPTWETLARQTWVTLNHRAVTLWAAAALGYLFYLAYGWTLDVKAKALVDEFRLVDQAGPRWALGALLRQAALVFYPLYPLTWLINNRPADVTCYGIYRRRPPGFSSDTMVEVCRSTIGPFYWHPTLATLYICLLWLATIVVVLAIHAFWTTFVTPPLPPNRPW